MDIEEIDRMRKQRLGQVKQNIFLLKKQKTAICERLEKEKRIYAALKKACEAVR